MRPALAAVLLAATAAAVPAAATPAPPPHCATFLLNAPAGRLAGCSTLGEPPKQLGSPYRTLVVTVQAGAVHATLQCSGTNPVELDVVAPYARSAVLRMDFGSYCWATLTALFDGTTAEAVNTYGMVFS